MTSMYRPGSSPRMWGTLPWRNHRVLFRRFIPTHVGNTHFLYLSITSIPVHPHACGEHRTLYRIRWEDAGSSPRMWGTPAPGAQALVGYRFIPTHVGNTRPRATTDATMHGSSPRMWGTPVEPGIGAKLDRFIPTHVGNTTGTAPASVVDAVHPHACGEHTYRTALFLKKKKHLEKSTASSSIPWSDPEAGMPPIAARRTTLDVDG